MLPPAVHAYGCFVNAISRKRRKPFAIGEFSCWRISSFTTSRSVVDHLLAEQQIPHALGLELDREVEVVRRQRVDVVGRVLVGRAR